jgi:hypothetical protein
MTNPNLAQLLSAEEHQRFTEAMDVMNEVANATQKSVEAAASEDTLDQTPEFMPMDEVDLEERVAEAEDEADLTPEDRLAFHERYAGGTLSPDAAFKKFKEKMANDLKVNELLADILDADEQPEQAISADDSVKTYANARRATSAAGPSPYSTGDGMLTAAPGQKVEGGGYVISGQNDAGTARRATRPVTTIGETEAYVGRHESGAVDDAATEYAGRHRASKNLTHKRDGIADLVTLDKSGRARYESGVKKGRSIKGRFMTRHELDLIEDNQELIREGMVNRAAAKEAAAVTAPQTHDFSRRTADMDQATRDAVFANLRQAEAGTSPSSVAPELARPAQLSEKAWAAIKDDPAAQQRAVELYATKEAENKDLKRPERISESTWDKLNDEERQRATERLANKPAESKAFWKRVLGRIAKTDENGRTEIKLSRRKVVATAVTGALAVAALFASSMPKDGEVQAKAPQTVGNQVSPENNPGLVQAPAKKVEAGAKKIVHKVVHEAAPHTVTFKKGDTIWHTAEMELKKQGVNHATPAQIDGLSDHLRAINGHMTEKQAKNLLVGYKLKVDK